MYKIDEYVVHVTGGICKVENIAPLSISAADKGKNYYFLVPVSKKGSIVYVPVDSDSAIRKIYTAGEAESLMSDIPSIEAIDIENDKLREAKYKEVIKSCDLKDLVSILKNLSKRRAKRLSEGKKNTATDEKYFKIAVENLCCELAFSLEKSTEEIKEAVINMI